VHSVAAAEKASPEFHASVAGAVEQAHAKLWSGHVDRNGIILDYIGEIPAPEDCTLGKPNAIGWRSPLANGAMFTGLYLPAACERARRSGAAADKDKARRLAAGLLKCASVSDVPGFIARGIGTDGKCHYPAGSDDQTHPWFEGLHAYLQSGLPSTAERAQIVDKMKQVADALESAGWKCPCDGAFKGQSRGAFKGHLFRDAVRYLHMLSVMADVTRDNVWLERYRKAAAERPAKSDKTRAEICAAGYGLDREAIKGIDEHSLWIYVGSQAALANLAAQETAATLRALYRAGLAINAANVRAALDTCKEFNNADTQIFGHANWRAVYTNWFVQRTQADAEKLAECEDKAKGGKRKAREARSMRNPLAAAAIAALAGDGTGRDAIERALRHYDYTKLHMSEFFFAECAYYALPAPPAWVATASAEWKAVPEAPAGVVAGSALDFSRLVAEGPAGKYGRVIARTEGGFAFEQRPQQRVYFLGCSISPGSELKDKSKEELEAYAENIRRQGYNIVRPHFLDGALTDGAKEDLEFNIEFLDRFDYFVSCLKRRGIYLYLDAMTSWKGYTKVKTWSKEGTALQFKQRIYVEEAVRAHWEQGVRKLLTHLNPYTRTRLVEDPMVAVVLFFNEQNLNLFGSVPQLLEQPWREFLAKKYGTIEALRKAWVSDKGRPLLATSVTLKNVPLFTPSTFWEHNQRGIDYGLFITGLETDLTRWYLARIRAMGYQGLVTHCDWLQHFRNAVPRNEVDVISMHGYHAHPSDFDNRGSTISQASSLADELNWWRGIAGTRFLDRPFALTEYGHVYWNRYRYEEGLAVGGYSAFQDHDLLMAHASPVRSKPNPGVMRPFGVGQDPVARASQVISGLLFMRHDVSPAAHTVQLEIRPEELFTTNNISGALPRDQSRIQLVTRFGITYTGSKPPAGVPAVTNDVKLRVSGAAKVVSTDWVASVLDGPDTKFSAALFFAGLKEKKLLPAANRTDVAKGWFETENGQLFLDAGSRRLELRTPRSEGVCDARFAGPHQLGSLTVLSSSKPAQVAALSLDDRPLKESRRILLVYATDALNSGATFAQEDRVLLREKGNLPVLMQCGILSVALKNRHAAALSVWSLGLDGTRRDQITTVKVSGDELTLTLDTAALAAGPTPFFEIAEK
jgi:hypothetical protein